MRPEDYNIFEKAQKRVTQIKNFYNHILIFVMVNIVVLVGWYAAIPRIGVLDAQNTDFNNWIFWNVILFPVIWGIALIIHGLVAFGKFGFIRRWEERKIDEYMEQEEHNNYN